jgi:hypothetical protein
VLRSLTRPRDSSMRAKLSNNIIQKGLAFGRDWSGTVANSGSQRAPRDPAPPAPWPRWGFGGAARRRYQPNGGSRCQRLRRSHPLGQHTRPASPTCLLNGPASTGCSDFRRASSPFEPSLCRRRSHPPRRSARRMVAAAPDVRAAFGVSRHSKRVSACGGLRCRETGFRGRRKKRQNVARDTDRRSQRPHGRTKTRQLRAFPTTSRNSPQTVNCVVVEAVSCELVSRTKFPANREINREFRRIRRAIAIFVSDQPADSIAYSGIPYATEQGIFKCVSGNFFSKNREI